MAKQMHPNSLENLKKGKATQFVKGDPRVKLGNPASIKARAEKRTMQEEMKIALDTLIKNNKGEDVSVRSAIVLAQIKKALNGDCIAFKNCGEYSDEKPAEKHEVIGHQTIDIQEVKKLKKLLDD